MLLDMGWLHAIVHSIRGQAIILQPASGPDARRHYDHTIAHPVPLEDIAPVLAPSDLESLNPLCPGGTVAIWGVTPSKIGQWSKMGRGDTVLFSRERQLFARAEVIYKCHNQSLAEFLWGRDEDGQTWEYLYFIDNLRSLDMPDTELIAVAHLDPDYRILAVQVLGSAPSQRILTHLNSM